MSKLSFGSTATVSMSDGSGDSNLNDLKMFSACLPMAYIRDDTWISPSSLCNRVAILCSDKIVHATQAIEMAHRTTLLPAGGNSAYLYCRGEARILDHLRIKPNN